MTDDVCRLLRYAVHRQILRTGANDKTNKPDATGNQSAVRQCANTHGDVDMLLQEIGNLIAEDKANINVRVSFEKVRNNRNDMQATEHDRRGYGEASFCGAVLT